MVTLKYAIDITASKEIVWTTLWSDESFRDWASIIDEGTYLQGELVEGNLVQFLSAVNGYGVTSLIKKLSPYLYILFWHSADTKDTGAQLRDKEWTGGTESYTLSEKRGITTLTVESEVPDELEELFRERLPESLERIKFLAEDKMMWVGDILDKLKKKNKMLFTRDSQCLQTLISLMDKQNHRTLVMWAQDCANDTLEHFELGYPDEIRPRTCLERCEKWARGEIKMPEAKRAILDAHAVAKEIDDDVSIALCHAIGHAGATVHVGTHALGLPIYELTAIVLKHDVVGFEKPVREKINHYYTRLLYWSENTDKLGLTWATFLRD